ncbi:hypothetical protein CAOG_07220 [Capsaspora owczarzaki ATCC 30864]|uniref:hypothetical protein n=1 Tax=Capsaspora owczarzaki (strain ATCC 30864) TaxID=595528 RepID=UPI0001FE2C2C|nr:hypothetical protein CAOG_07220 [Capsaspora owczarzaki ATCC 30864]|eukprot:XP_004343079.1 hypothetical protein CAOG_07220 [Capsaspora owczarzaki ATCC 30864]
MLTEVLDAIRSYNNNKAVERAHGGPRRHQNTSATSTDFVVVGDSDKSDVEHALERNEFWFPLFQSYFLECKDTSRDDLLFYVHQDPPLPPLAPALAAMNAATAAAAATATSSSSSAKPANPSSETPSSSTSSSNQQLPQAITPAAVSAAILNKTHSRQPSTSGASQSASRSGASTPGSPVPPMVPDEPFFVRRSNHQQPAPFDRAINWEETFYLNLILNQFEYSLTVAICRTVKEPIPIVAGAPAAVPGQPPRTRDRLVIHKKVTQRVYPSPSKRNMDSGKAEETELTYPHIFFTVDNFDEIFSEVYIVEDECLCLEMVAWPHGSPEQKSTVFQGSVVYAALLNAYQAKVKKSTPLYLSLLARSRGDVEFLMLRGPGGKGEAQVAMSRLLPHGSGSSLPVASQQQQQQASSDAGQPATAKAAAAALSSPSTTTSSSSSSSSASSEVKRIASWSFGMFDSAVKKVQAYAATKKQQVSGPQKGDSPALNAFLTFISLPWDLIVKDVVTHQTRPVLETLPETKET